VRFAGLAAREYGPAMPLPDGDKQLAHRLVDQGALLLDVRTQAEYDEHHLPNSLLIPHTEVGARIAEILAAQGGDKHKPIVVFCRRGGRAATAKAVLMQHGFTEITNLGGIDDWS
jgi:phage shock protein E